MTYQNINLSYLNKMAGDDVEMQRTLLIMLFEELSAAIPQMQRYLEKEQWDELKSAAHKMKSTLSFTGNAVMQEANMALWQRLSDGIYSPPLSPLLQVLSQTGPKVIEELQQASAELAG
ncbi:MAG: Hpt domain-containing protein [Saprospiraceae bacterium]|nr:Hpt domain-containing protein [Saprospiraceae bacterium]